MNNNLNELFVLFDEKNELEDRMEMINLKIEVAKQKIKAREQSLKETVLSSKMSKVNWIRDI